MPGAEVRVKVIVMAVWLIGNALWRADVDPTGDGSSGFIIENGHVNPVPTAIHHFQLQARCFDFSLGLKLAPVSLSNFRPCVFYCDRGRGDGGHFDIRQTRLFILRLAPAFEVVRQKFAGGLLR